MNDKRNGSLGSHYLGHDLADSTGDLNHLVHSSILESNGDMGLVVDLSLLMNRRLESGE